MAIRYYQYDYDKGIVTEYARKGQCLRCGDCCRAVITFQWTGNAVRGNGKNGGDSTQCAGLWQVVEDGDELRCYKLTAIEWRNDRCCHLDEKDNCTGHDDPTIHMGICQDWPMGPQCNEGLPTCGFRFEPIAAWRWLPDNTFGEAIPVAPAMEVPA